MNTPDDFEKWQRQGMTPEEFRDWQRMNRVWSAGHLIKHGSAVTKTEWKLPEGYHGRYNELSLSDVQMLISMGIDPLGDPDEN